MDSAGDVLYDALPLPEGRTARRRVCDHCQYEIPVAKFARHSEFCAAFFKRQPPAAKCLQKHGALPFLRRTLKVPALTFSTLEARGDTLVDDVFAAQRLALPAAQVSDLPQKLVEAMEEAARLGGVRAAGNEAKHWAQEAAICAGIQPLLADFLDVNLTANWEVESVPPGNDTAAVGNGGDAQGIDAVAHTAISLEDAVCVIELGAGGGELIHMVQCMAHTAMVLVDYYPAPRMVDPLYEGQPRFARLWKHLEDVTAADLTPFLRRVNVVVAKHLCGAAFDAALQKVQQWRSTIPIHLLAMVPCCQHGSLWETYVGRQWWLQRGYSEADFRLVTQKMNWKNAKNCATENRRVLYHVGRTFEALHAYGRKAWLQDQGFHTDLVYYIGEGSTMRNLLFLATALPGHAAGHALAES